MIFQFSGSVTVLSGPTVVDLSRTRFKVVHRIDLTGNPASPQRLDDHHPRLQKVLVLFIEEFD